MPSEDLEEDGERRSERKLQATAGLVDGKWAFIINMILMPFPMCKALECWHNVQVFHVLERGEEVKFSSTTIL